jgi:hypothetical protein
MQGMAWTVNSGVALSTMKSCGHPSVFRDPILKGFSCTKCHWHFDVVPDAKLEPPRAMTLWQRIKWAFRRRTKVKVVEFEWSHGWAKLRAASSEMMQWHRQHTPDMTAPVIAKPDPIYKREKGKLPPIYKHKASRKEDRAELH